MTGSWDYSMVWQGDFTSLDQAVALFASHDAQVVWLGTLPMPVDAMRPAGWQELLNGVFRSMAESRPEVSYLDTAPVIGDDLGRFTRFHAGADGSRVPVRKADKHHVCAAGSALLGTAVPAELTEGWDLPPPDPSWVDGNWRDDPVYTNPPEACLP